MPAATTLPDIDSLIRHGFYPRIWDKQIDPTQALGDYFETYIERDLGQLATIKNLGIENARQVTRDPLRGNLFENMVIVEALKSRLHQGKRSNLYFYRDSKGNEVDLLFAGGTEIFPIEIKAGMTITREYFKGLNHIAGVFRMTLPGEWDWFTPAISPSNGPVSVWCRFMSCRSFYRGKARKQSAYAAKRARRSPGRDQPVRD